MNQKIEQCPQCKSSSEVGPYVNGAGLNMFACGRCFIQWRSLASHAPHPSPDICEKCGQKVIDGHWSLVCHKPACIKALQEGEVSISYDLPIKRCFNLEDHSEHSWEYKNELHKCPGMPIQPSEAAAQPTERKVGHKALRWANGKLETFDPHPEIEHNDH